MYLNFIGLIKAGDVKKAIPGLEFHEYLEDKVLGIVTTIDEYIKRTVSWRERAKSQLLLGYVKPHVDVSSSTVSRWIKETVKVSRIDVTTFKVHSTRAASSSKQDVHSYQRQIFLKLDSQLPKEIVLFTSMKAL